MVWLYKWLGGADDSRHDSILRFGASIRPPRIRATVASHLPEPWVLAAASGGEHAGQRIECGGHQPVVRPFAALCPFQQAGLDQNLEMV